MTPRYHAIMQYWKDNQAHLSMEHMVWDPTPWIIDIRSPYPDNAKDGDVDHWEHIQWLQAQVGIESRPIHGHPGDWRFAGATVDGETWLGFRNEDMMRRFIEAFPGSVIERTMDGAAMPANTTNNPPDAAPTMVDGGAEDQP